MFDIRYKDRGCDEVANNNYGIEKGEAFCECGCFLIPELYSSLNFLTMERMANKRLRKLETGDSGEENRVARQQDLYD